jgi:hypothetical protein
VWLQQLKTYVNNFVTASSAKDGRYFIFRTAFLINSDNVPQNKDGLNSVLGIAARQGLDGPGSNPRGSEILPAVKPDPKAHSDSCIVSSGVFPGIKRPWRGDNHPHHSSTKIAKGVGANNNYLVFIPEIPSLPLCACRGRVFQLFQDVYNKFMSN